MNQWFTELQTPDMAISCRTSKLLHHEKTPFQELAIYDTIQFGRMLTLDDVIQTTIKDEFVYHEMITHVGLNTHPCPRRVLVIGGGDGGSIREILKHSQVEKATLVEIDGRVVETSKMYLPEISRSLEDPRLEIIVDDGIEHVRRNKCVYDMIIVDSTDPVGPAVGLFALEFYRNIFESLTGEGLFVAQTESPFFNSDLIREVFKNISSVFPVARLYLACVPTYPGGMWSFTMGSKKHDPLKADPATLPDCRYYSPELHKAAFTLPPFVAEMVKS